MDAQAIRDSYPAPSRILPTKTALELLHEKGHEVWAVAPTASVYEAIELMAEKRVGALLVMQGPTLAGIVSERDYARRVVLQGRSSRETSVKQIMSADVVTVGPNDDLELCMKLMTDHHFRHLPVVDQGSVIGVVSIGDMVRVTIAQQRYLLDELERYVSG
jgi:CBS domain-containing protein